MATCVHGNDPRQCLVCQVLRSTGGPADPSGATVTQTQTRTRGGRTEVVRPDLVSTGSGRAMRMRSPAGRLLSTVLAIGILVIAVLLLLGTLHAILRLFELGLVALAALWVGYRIGHFVGRRGR
jgi:hypothetical protein